MAETMTGEQQVAEDTIEATKHAVEKLKEGEPTRAIAEAREREPSMSFAYLAGGSILASLVLFLLKKRESAIFVGLWPPTILSMALFYKLLRPSEEIK